MTPEETARLRVLHGLPAWPDPPDGVAAYVVCVNGRSPYRADSGEDAAIIARSCDRTHPAGAPHRVVYRETP